MLSRLSPKQTAAPPPFFSASPTLQAPATEHVQSPHAFAWLRHADNAKTPKKFNRSTHSPSWHRWQQFTPPAGSLEEQEVPSPSKGLDSEAEQESIVFAFKKKLTFQLAFFLAGTTSI